MSKNENKSESLSLEDKMKQLESLRDWFNSDDFNLDEAMAKYQEAIDLQKSIKTEAEKLTNQIEILEEKD